MKVSVLVLALLGFTFIQDVSTKQMPLKNLLQTQGASSGSATGGWDAWLSWSSSAEAECEEEVDNSTGGSGSGTPPPES